MLLLDEGKLRERRQAVRGPLAPLYDSLSAELEPLVGREPYIPRAKALLSRAGGRCELDGATLDFDPWSPQQHRCPVCGTVHQGELHHRAWITSYQLWLAERAVHAAVFHALKGEERHAALARDILRSYAESYATYPNRDNVLGPTRLFFSTYLESIWLLQICIAADLLASAGDVATADMVRDRIIEPSSSLIAEYDEGLSNRQVWSNAALLASAALVGDAAAFDRVVASESGVRAHLTRALLADGTWYEGENYHQFALRGLWYAAVVCRVRGCDLGAAADERLTKAFAAPFVTALPDFTMPSRKDSQYAVSLRQWRFAELAELGLAWRSEPEIASALARCYEIGHKRRDTGRSRSTADVERNGPPSALTRADLSWRALLHALPELPPITPQRLRSIILEHQGFAVFRRSGEIYVALDYGESGGGHGHPDRLNILLSQGTTRWLDDLGTGSYVDPSLHWYRSTLAHNAPMLDGKSQPFRNGMLRAYDEREGLGWIVAEVHFPEANVRFERTVVVASDYMIDELRWQAPSSQRVELPMHLDAAMSGPALTPAALGGGGGSGVEDGFAFVREAQATRLSANTPVSLSGARVGQTLHAILQADLPTTLFSACAPGQPTLTISRFYLLRAEASSGTFRSFFAWEPNLSVSTGNADAMIVSYRDGQKHVHRRDAKGWHVELTAGAARSTIDLAGFRPPPKDARQRPIRSSLPPITVQRRRLPDGWLSELPDAARASLVTFELGQEHYRRSEDAWHAAGSPRATIAIGADDRALLVLAHVRAGHRRFTRRGVENPFDNENADTMAAGIQFYVRMPDAQGAWMLVPEADEETVRVRPIAGWGTMSAPRARWRATSEGYDLSISLSLPDPAPGELPIDVDIIVNETTAERERRRGQLVLSGGHGEFVYLRGDRHDPGRLIPLVLVS